MSDFDPIAAVEVLYRTDLPSSEWMSGLMGCIQPLLDPHHRGLFGGLYSCPDPLSFHAEPVLSLDVGDRLQAVFEEGLAGVGDEYITGTFLSPGIVTNSEVEGWSEIPPVRDGRLRELGFSCNLSICAVEPDGGGLCLSNFRAEPAVLSARDKPVFSKVFRHLLAAHRLHRAFRGRSPSPDTAAAVLDSNGRLHRAVGAAGDRLPREALRRAVCASEEARGHRRRRDPLAALGAWESLVMGRWTFVDHFESDGRRYILALENAQQPLGLHLLSPREREVVERALQGAHNKAIAYDLGLAHSTIKVLMSRAAFKLGVRTRRELLAKLQTERNRA